jgi:hypothetical protein
MDRHPSRHEGGSAFDRLNQSIPVPRPVRLALAAILLLGGALLVLSVLGLVLSTPREPLTTAALLIAVMVIGMGSGFFFVGVRLLRPATRSAALFGPRARTICGLLFGAAAIGMGIAAWRSDDVAPALQAVGVAFFSFLIFLSANSKR